MKAAKVWRDKNGLYWVKKPQTSQPIPCRNIIEAMLEVAHSQDDLNAVNTLQKVLYNFEDDAISKLYGEA